MQSFLRARGMGMAALAVVLCVSGLDRAHAVPIPNLYNTGVDNANNTLPAGSIDPHYTLVASDDPSFLGPNALVTNNPLPTLPTAWIGNSSTSQWISPNANQAGESQPVGNVQGTYIYQLTFDLTGLNSAQATITGSWAVDTLGLLFLNGVYVPGTTNFNGPDQLTAFSIPVGSNFLPTINTLQFVVVNSAAHTGLRVEGLGGTAPEIPEPSTVVLAGLGALGLVVLRRRTR